MYRTKLIIIAFLLILVTFGLAVWANTTQFNLGQRIKAKQVDSFEKCALAGYPVLESYPRQCHVPGGAKFVEKIDGIVEPPEFNASPSGFERIDDKICVDRCGDNFCAMIVCQGSGCPCSESKSNCPQDCSNF